MRIADKLEQIDLKLGEAIQVVQRIASPPLPVYVRCTGVTGEGCPSFNVLEAGELCCDECMEIYEGASHLIHPHRPFTSGGER